MARLIMVLACKSCFVSVIYTANEDYLEICQREDSFKCIENECIPINHKCNGVAECSNGADESLWECGCLPNEFFCNGTCIDSMLRCDTKSDCSDGSDEDDCKTYLCPYTHFKCNNHFCIAGDSVCNFVNDCGDNSDEQNCLHRACWFGEFTCNNGQCIRVALLCDGEVNCLDGSDETHCDKLRDYVQCGDKSLVHRYFWCDDWPDCKDSHADELNCKNCTHHEFRCSNSRCIAKANVCDMICDCADTCEDEKNCGQKYLMMGDVPMCSFSSTIFCPKTNRCIHENFICDGHNDCQSGAFGSDEYGCIRCMQYMKRNNS
uniref:EGF-like domain-containing protein n=1 Tax=Strigamia maritima TaxID=126957 RepID=T1JCU6_STRMM